MSGCRHQDVARGASTRTEPCESGDACPYALPAAKAAIRRLHEDARTHLFDLASGSVTRRERAERYAAGLDTIVGSVLA